MTLQILMESTRTFSTWMLRMAHLTVNSSAKIVEYTYAISHIISPLAV